MMEDYELEEQECPCCGHSPTRSRRCTEIDCVNGWIDDSEDSYSLPGTDLYPCPECKGAGFQHWCPKCGVDIYHDYDDDNE